MSRAFVDESGSNVKLDPNAYLLGAAVILEENIDDVRAMMQTFRLPGQRKLHWRAESEHRQFQITQALVALPLEAVLVAHVDADRRPEARRHRTIATLLPELHVHGIDHVEFESRGAKDDARDRKLLEDMRRSRRFGPEGPKLHMSHTAGHAEPCLWIADAICGAVVAHRTGDSQFVDILGDQLRLIDC